MPHLLLMPRCAQLMAHKHGCTCAFRLQAPPPESEQVRNEADSQTLARAEALMEEEADEVRACWGWVQYLQLSGGEWEGAYLEGKGEPGGRLMEVALTGEANGMWRCFSAGQGVGLGLTEE